MMFLKDIFCQQKAINILQRSLASDRLAGSWIFAGADGVGKFTTARLFAKLLLCQSPVITDDFADACGQCQSCKLIEADSHPDFAHIYKELIQYVQGKEGRKSPVEFPIDVVREFLLKKVSSRPAISERKVYIISEAEKLNAASQNALLKVLEEPPAFCFIILLCTRLDQLLQTTKSRCQIVRFGPIDSDQIESHLVKNSLDSTSARYFARLADGSIGQAVKLAELQQKNAPIIDTKKELLDDIASFKLADALAISEKCSAHVKAIAGVWQKTDAEASKTDINRKTQKLIISIIISALSDAMKAQFQPPEAAVNFDQPACLTRIAQRFCPEKAAEKITHCYDAIARIEANVNEKLIFDHLLLKLADCDTMLF